MAEETKTFLVDKPIRVYTSIQNVVLVAIRAIELEKYDVAKDVLLDLHSQLKGLKSDSL